METQHITFSECAKESQKQDQERGIPGYPCTRNRSDTTVKTG